MAHKSISSLISRPPSSPNSWQPRLGSFAENVAATAAIGGMSWLVGYPLVPWIVGHPILATTTAVVLGSGLTLALSRFVPRRNLPPRIEKTAYNCVSTILPSDSGIDNRTESIPVIQALEGLDWDDFVYGYKLLDEQIKKEDWTPSLVVSLNQGDALVGFLRDNDRLQNAKYGSILLDRHRNGKSVALPERSSFSGPIRTLLVDYQLKTGSVIDAALKILAAELDVTRDDVRVAVLVLGELNSIPPSGRSYALSHNAFKPRFANFSVEDAKKRVSRLYYLAFLCASYPTPPWNRQRAEE